MIHPADHATLLKCPGCGEQGPPTYGGACPLCGHPLSPDAEPPTGRNEQRYVGVPMGTAEWPEDRD